MLLRGAGEWRVLRGLVARSIEHRGAQQAWLVRVQA
jgi:hypothetical protein